MEVQTLPETLAEARETAARGFRDAINTLKRVTMELETFEAWPGCIEYLRAEFAEVLDQVEALAILADSLIEAEQ